MSQLRFISKNLFVEIFSEEFFDLGKRYDIFLIVEVGVACPGNHYEKLVVFLARSDGEFLVSVVAEIEGMGFLSMKNHHGVLNLSGTAHKREVDPWNRRCGIAAAVRVKRAVDATADVITEKL